MRAYSTKYLLVRRDDCLHIDTSTPSVEGESIATPSAMSERDERIGRSVTKTFVDGVLPDLSKSDSQDRDLPKNRREVFVQNKARRNWQDKCFSRDHHNSFIEITATASSRTKGNV
jgi:hypothetical protein